MFIACKCIGTGMKKGGEGLGRRETGHRRAGIGNKKTRTRRAKPN
jgi:hypothetical protein